MSMAHVDAQGSHVVVFTPGSNQYNYTTVVEAAPKDFDEVLQKLKPANMDPSMRSGCLAGTGVDVIQRILEWASDRTSHQNILWLSGIAGSGKSTLSTSIADQFRRWNRLGGFLFFNRDVAERSDPNAVIRTLAYQLGTFHPPIGDSMADVIQATPNILLSPIHYQFDQLIADLHSAVASMPIDLPVVFVIDALDECGTMDTREALMEIFSEKLGALLSFRFIITSRPDVDIAAAFDSHPSILRIEVDITSPRLGHDISLYFTHQAMLIRKRKRHLGRDWPGEASIQSLTARASGLFVWASTAAKFINSHDPVKRLNILLQGDANQLAEKALDTLYMTALQSVGMWDDGEFVSDFRDIMGVVLALHKPLSAVAIDQLLTTLDGRPTLDTVSQIGCVVSSIPVVRILHPSFADFLLDRSRCDRDVWYFQKEVNNITLTMLCIQRLDKFLKRNMCNMALSANFVELEGSLAEDIAYACIFWIAHVCAVDDEPSSLLDGLAGFFSKHAIHWFEAMSILGRSRDTIFMLQNLMTWTKSESRPDRKRLLETVDDAHRFAQTFAKMIEEHPLLVYYSALPFSPIHSGIYQTHHDHHIFPALLKGYRHTWSSQLLVMGGKEISISALAISPDGSRVACGAFDSMIRVWDTTSGAEIFRPLQGHRIWILSLTYSRDGSRLASCGNDGTLRIWDNINGQEVLQISFPSGRSGDKQFPCSAAFTPDGSHVVSGSNKGLIQTWDSYTGTETSPAIRGHTDVVVSISISHDGTRIVSGADDRTIRVWDTTLRVEILPTLQVPGARALFASLLTNGTIVSVSADTLRILNASTGSCIMMLQTDGIASAAVSPNGAQVSIAYNDNSIRILDTETGTEVLPPLQGHKARVSALAYSPDGSKTVSGSHDGTVRVWDAGRAGECNFDSSPHRGPVTHIIFSPDGSRIATLSSDSIIIWDAESGLEVLPPLPTIKPELMNSVAFSPDGTRIVSTCLSPLSSGTIRVLDLRTGLVTMSTKFYLLRMLYTSWSAEFCPEGHRILVYGHNRVLIIDVHSGAQLFAASFPEDLKDDSARFSSDGAAVVTFSNNGKTSRAWRITPDSLTPHWEIVPACPSSHRYEPSLIALSTSWGSQGWVLNLETKEVISKLPDEIYHTSTDSYGRSLAVGTKSGGVFIIRFPPSALE